MLQDMDIRAFFLKAAKAQGIRTNTKQIWEACVARDTAAEWRDGVANGRKLSLAIHFTGD